LSSVVGVVATIALPAIIVALPLLLLHLCLPDYGGHSGHTEALDEQRLSEAWGVLRLERGWDGWAASACWAAAEAIVSW